MKCPKCQTVNKARFTHRCIHCSYLFEFNPKVEKMSDGLFTAIVKKASANGSQYYTRNQLFYAWVTTRYNKETYTLRAVLLPLGVIACIAAAVFQVFVAYYVIVPMMVIALFLPIRLSKVDGYVDSTLFQDHLRRWQSSSKPLPYFIESPSLASAPVEFTEPDISDQSVSKVLFLEKDILVDLFVRNDFHAKEHILVVSNTGYPMQVFDVFEKMIAGGAQPTIYALHSPSEEGMKMASGLKEKYPNSRIVDLGLTRSQYDAMKPYELWTSTNRCPLDGIPFANIAAALSICFASDVGFTEGMSEYIGTRQNWGDSGSYG